MAKSIRSKWKRKCRAIKRERYGEKELLRLKKTLDNGSSNNTNDKNSTINAIKEVTNIVTANDIIESESREDNLVDMEEIRREYNPKTLRDKNGAYPVWLHPRKIKSTKRKNKRKGKKK